MTPVLFATRLLDALIQVVSKQPGFWLADSVRRQLLELAGEA